MNTSEAPTADLLTTLTTHRVVPVITIRDAARANELGSALISGGLPLAEITFRTNQAAESIEILRSTYPQMCVGAGSVLDVATLDLAVDAGAQFIVAPGFNPAVVDKCLELGLPVVPGANTPSEIDRGLSAGLTLFKFFPAEATGGVPYLSAVAGPYRTALFMPTGGITLGNLPNYLNLANVSACGGTWIASESAISDGRFDDIAANAASATQVALPYSQTN